MSNHASVALAITDKFTVTFLLLLQHINVRINQEVHDDPYGNPTTAGK